MAENLVIRPAIEADLDAITAIYAASVLHGTGTFETVPPDSAEMAARYAKIIAMGAPYLVASDAAGVLGYAYGGPFRERAAFRFILEDSVYISAAARGRGVGRALLEALLAAATEAGFRQMLSLIGDSANRGSIRLHETCGFSHVGTMPATGWKHGRWLDVVIMQRALGLGATQPAETI